MIFWGFLPEARMTLKASTMAGPVFVSSRACVATHYVRTVKCTIVCGFRVRSTDPVLHWIVKSEANYICKNHFRPPGSDRMHGERERR